MDKQKERKGAGSYEMEHFNCSVSSDCPWPMMCYANVSGSWEDINCYCNVYYGHEWDSTRQKCLFKGPIANSMLVFSVACLVVTGACLPRSFANVVRLTNAVRTRSSSDPGRGLKVVSNLSLAAFASLLTGVAMQVAYLLERVWVDGMTFHYDTPTDLIQSDVLLYRNVANLLFTFSIMWLLCQIVDLWICQVEAAGTASSKKDWELRVAKSSLFWLSRGATILFGVLVFISLDFLILAVMPFAVICVLAILVLGSRLLAILNRTRRFQASFGNKEKARIEQFDRSIRMIKRHISYLVGILLVLVVLFVLFLTSPYPSKDPNDSRIKIHFSYIMNGCFTLLPVSGFLVAKELAENVMTRRNSRLTRVGADNRRESKAVSTTKRSTMTVTESVLQSGVSPG